MVAVAAGGDTDALRRSDKSQNVAVARRGQDGIPDLEQILLLLLLGKLIGVDSQVPQRNKGLQAQPILTFPSPASQPFPSPLQKTKRVEDEMSRHSLGPLHLDGPVHMACYKKKNARQRRIIINLQKILTQYIYRNNIYHQIGSHIDQSKKAHSYIY